MSGSLQFCILLAAGRSRAAGSSFLCAGYPITSVYSTQLASTTTLGREPVDDPICAVEEGVAVPGAATWRIPDVRVEKRMMVMRKSRAVFCRIDRGGARPLRGCA